MQTFTGGNTRPRSADPGESAPRSLERLVEEIRRIDAKRRDEGGVEDRADDLSIRNADSHQPALHHLLTAGAIHEWFGPFEPSEQKDEQKRDPSPAAASRSPRSSRSSRSRHWLPPIGAVMHAVQRLVDRADGAAHHRSRRVLWIGRTCRPYPIAMAFARAHRANSSSSRCDGAGVSATLLERSIFVDPETDAQRLWAIDLALRSPAVAVVVADGRRLHMAETRRLQMAASSGNGATGLVIRPPWEMNELSAARTRWKAYPVANASWLVGDDAKRARAGMNRCGRFDRSERPGWIVELWRCKQAGMGHLLAKRGARRWGVVQQRDGEYIETSAFGVDADVSDRVATPTRSERRRSA